MKFENTDVYNFKNAIRGMRLPMNSNDKSDSKFWDLDIEIGDNDLDLMQRLIKGGSEHRKFMRQIFVSVDITAPMYWFSEFDTYKIGTVANSTSKMHKLASTPITKDCFEMDDFSEDLPLFDNEPYGVDENITDGWIAIIDICETLRKRYLETKDKRYWKELIRILPEGWLQTRTWTANYEILYNMVRQRKGHKLSEWKQFIDWVATLPYAKELIFLEDDNDGTKDKEA